LPSWRRTWRADAPLVVLVVALEQRLVKPQLLVELGRQSVAAPAVAQSIPDSNSRIRARARVCQAHKKLG
jgi:hypothetical protein